MSFHSVTAHRWWPWGKRIGIAGFLAFVLLMLVHEARTIDWHEVFATMRGYPLGVVCLAALLAWTSHLIYSTFDLIGRHYTAHPLRKSSVMAITFVSYAFNLNLGTVVGALAMRVRLYTRLGLEAPVIARIVGLSMLTNWLGYCLMAGLAFLLWPMPLPADWHLGGVALRVLGGVLVLAALGYLGLCFLAKRREFSVRGHEITLPNLRLACLQLAISCANWSVMGATMFVLLQGQVAYPVALSVLLIGAISGLMSRVPAGLGVLEAVFIALLSPPLSTSTLVAAVLTYRAVYYWAPLAVASVVYLAMEANAKKLAAHASEDTGAQGQRLQPSC